MTSAGIRNGVLVSVDTLRADHLGCYGYHRLTSPHLDRLAAGGVRFARCISPHIPTHPGHTTMLTGRDAISHQVICHGGDVELAADIPLLPELLAARGFRTAAADNLKRWFLRGFADYRPYEWERAERVWRKAEGVQRTALEALDAAAADRRPFFLFVHYWDPHTPYFPPAPFDRLFYPGDPTDARRTGMAEALALEPFREPWGRWWGHVTDIAYPVSQYDGAIAYWDATFAAFTGRLEELGLRDQTLLVVTADHGEEMTEHRMWFDHHGLYDTNVHVPLLLSAPGALPAGRVVERTVSLLDVAPTILDLLGLGPLAAGMDGRSLVPLLQGDPAPATPEPALLLTECSWMKKRAVRTDRWKAIFALEPDFHDRPPVELYDLLLDPQERCDLAAARPEVVAEMRQTLERRLRERMAATGHPDPFAYQDLSMARARNELVRQGKRATAEPRGGV